MMAGILAAAIIVYGLAHLIYMVGWFHGSQAHLKEKR